MFERGTKLIRRAQITVMALFVEIRSYNLKPGNREEFHRLFVKTALPMLKRWNVDVMRYGASSHDEDTYYLMRAYASLEDRQQSQDAFYGSDEWKLRPREPIIALIENYTLIVIETEESTVDVLRQ